MESHNLGVKTVRVLNGDPEYDDTDIFSLSDGQKVTADFKDKYLAGVPLRGTVLLEVKEWAGSRRNKTRDLIKIRAFICHDNKKIHGFRGPHTHGHPFSFQIFSATYRFSHADAIPKKIEVTGGPPFLSTTPWNWDVKWIHDACTKPKDKEWS